METKVLNRLDGFLLAEKNESKEKGIFSQLNGGPFQGETPTDVIPAIISRHPLFALVSSLAFAALYAELMFFVTNYYGANISPTSGLSGVVGVFILTFAGTWFSFSLPHYFYRPRFSRYSPIIFLVTEWTASILIIIGVTLISFAVGIYLVGGNLGGVGELLRSLALYAIAAIVCFHGLVTFARYVQYLYERDLHQSYKIVSAAGLTVGILLIVTLYLLQYDLGRMGSPDAQRDLVALHLSLRDIWLIGMNMFVLFWTYSRLADH